MKDKPRLAQVDAEMTKVEFEAMLAQHKQGDLSHPYIFTSAGLPGRYWADADELRAWRASQSTSEGPQR